MKEKIAHYPDTKKFEKTVVAKYRNYKFILYTLLGGVSLLFLSLTFMYYVHSFNTSKSTLKITPVYFINTFILLASSITIVNVQQYFIKNKYKNYSINLLLILLFGSMFLIGQTFAAYKMYFVTQNQYNNNVHYLYLITAIHALHTIFGLSFLVYYIASNWKLLNNYATSVVHFTDPVAKAQFGLFARYWHFLGVIWLYLLFFFLTVS